MDWAEDDEDSADDQEEAEDGGKKPRRPVRLLDYACGTGTISRVIMPPLPDLDAPRQRAGCDANMFARLWWCFWPSIHMMMVC